MQKSHIIWLIEANKSNKHDYGWRIMTDTIYPPKHGKWNVMVKEDKDRNLKKAGEYND